MFRNILVPLDGSENAYRTLEYAANLAKKFEPQINVLSVSAPKETVILKDIVTVQHKSLKKVIKVVKST